MESPQRLVMALLSDTTFGRGEGTVGEVDVEVEHDDLGLPFLGGKALHGLLRDAWLTMAAAFPTLMPAAERLLGPSGDLAEMAILRIGDAVVEDGVRQWIAAAVRNQDHPLAAADILRALSDIRWQTSEDRKTGGPATGTLRTSRVVIRGLKLEAQLGWLAQPGSEELRVLALAALGTRHAGIGRNRGRGHVSLAVNGDADYTRILAEGKSS